MNYELVLLTKPNLTEDQNKKILEGIKDQVKNVDGKVAKEELWGKRHLAYEIKRLHECYYSSLFLDMPSPGIKKLGTKLNVLPEVVRYLFIKKD